MAKHSRLSFVVLTVFYIFLLPPAGVDSETLQSDGLDPLPTLSPEDLERLRSKEPATPEDRMYRDISPMGAIAAGLLPFPGAQIAAPSSGKGLSGENGPPAFSYPSPGGDNKVVHGPGDYGYQSETTIDINTSGTVLVAGYNDVRGFDVSPVSVSGVARSTDGGLTWNEVPVGPGGLGVLPAAPGGSVFGDPEVKYDKWNNRFIYASLYTRPSDLRTGLCIHISNANASSWTGPIEVTPSFIASNFSDKEFMAVNPNTGRILITWTNFPSGGFASIARTYSDDGGATWAPAITISGTLTQASIPRFHPGATNALSKAYCVWRFVSGATRNIGFSRSLDGGLTWSVPISITTDFTNEDLVLGVDRINVSPSLAVDQTGGNIYVVYMRPNATGTGDVAFQRSIDAGVNFSAAVLIDSDPGNDRGQFYPWVAVDQSSGRIHAMWYDQDIDASGDRIELMHTMSTDGGLSWSAPIPLSDRPFHAGHGNDTSQPNIGDYNQAVAQNGKLHAVAAVNLPEPRFDEGQPTLTRLNVPDTHYIGRPVSKLSAPPLRVSQVAVAESGCLAGSNSFLDPGEEASFTVSLENYNLNALTGAGTVSSIQAVANSFTPGAAMIQSVSAYPNIASGAVQANSVPFKLKLPPSHVAGKPIEMLLSLVSAQGSREIPFYLSTGTPGTTTILLEEDFEDVVAPALPSGWSSVNIGFTAQTPWVTGTTLTPTNAAYHPEAGNASAHWEALQSPSVVVPTPAPGVESQIVLDFDAYYNLEVEPTLQVMAYDGMLVRLRDETPGGTTRNVIAEAFADSITDGAIMHYPRHLFRFTNSSYFEDMSVWSGDSGGAKHQTFRFPGAGMGGRTIRARFDYTEDTIGVCSTAPCGASVDNVVLKQVLTASSPCEVKNAAREWQTYPR